MVLKVCEDESSDQLGSETQTQSKNLTNKLSSIDPF